MNPIIAGRRWMCAGAKARARKRRAKQRARANIPPPLRRGGRAVRDAPAVAGRSAKNVFDGRFLPDTDRVVSPPPG